MWPHTIGRGHWSHLWRVSDICSTYKKFGISFWYKRKGDSTTEMGLISNGNCETEPSIGINSRDGAVYAVLITKNKKVTIEIPVGAT